MSFSNGLEKLSELLCLVSRRGLYHRDEVQVEFKTSLYLYTQLQYRLHYNFSTSLWLLTEEFFRSQSDYPLKHAQVYGDNLKAIVLLQAFEQALGMR